MDSNSLLSMNLALNVARKCRICGMDILDLTCAFPIFGNERLDRKIERYLHLNVHMDDLLPKCICGSCYLKLESIDQFALMANRTEEAFRAWIGRLRGLNCPTEVAKNVNVVLPLFRPDPELLEAQKSPPIHAASSPKDSTSTPAGDKSAISYSDLKLGLLIKDQELLKLILKALKWAENDRRASFEVLIQRLKNTSFREILSNRNLLNDSDLTQLLKSYIGQGVMNSPLVQASSTAGSPLSNNNNGPSAIVLQPGSVVQPAESFPDASVVKDIVQSTPSQLDGTVLSGGATVNEYRIDEGNVTQMEVGVDPDLYLPYEDEDSNSTTKYDVRIEERQENTVTIKLVTTNLAGDMIENKRMIPAILNVRGSKRFQCSGCPECFATNGELQQHIVTRHMHRTNRTVITEKGKPAIKIRVRKNKPLSVVATGGVGGGMPLVIPSLPILCPPPPPPTTPLRLVEVEEASPEGPVTIVPLKIPASTTITVVPASPSRVEDVILPPKGDGEGHETPAIVSVTSEMKLPVESPPKVELLVRKSKRKPVNKMAKVKPRLTEADDKQKSRKVKKQDPPQMIVSVEQPTKHPRRTSGVAFCSLCRKRLPVGENLREHMEKEHARFECRMCDRVFKNALNLGRHQQCHGSGSGGKGGSGSGSGGKAKKPAKGAQTEAKESYKCTQCEKSFRRNQNLQLHMYHHTRNAKMKTSAPEVKPTAMSGASGLRKRTKLTSATGSGSSVEGSRVSRKSEVVTRKSAMTRKVRFST
ncbi:uncharacterized protein LOC128725495 [Anopheles nili]|uniref:uncharacterized protein LOC128725495 n=1 Tax=Anopheles nili TaxID=185578 RepID=UPI00237BCA04|nr:uncharacterized protein LOC128725495 [Anopheles nili]